MNDKMIILKIQKQLEVYQILNNYTKKGSYLRDPFSLFCQEIALYFHGHMICLATLGQTI